MINFNLIYLLINFTNNTMQLNFNIIKIKFNCKHILKYFYATISFKIFLFINIRSKHIFYLN